MCKWIMLGVRRMVAKEASPRLHLIKTFKCKFHIQIHIDIQVKSKPRIKCKPNSESSHNVTCWLCANHPPRDPMDTASAYGAGDCRLESCRCHEIVSGLPRTHIRLCEWLEPQLEHASSRCLHSGHDLGALPRATRKSVGSRIKL